MYPTLIRLGELSLGDFSLGDFSLSSYFTLIAFGYLLAALMSWYEAKRVGIDPDDVLDIALYGLIFGVLGARLLHVFADGFFWDYVHLCTDPFLVEGRDLQARPLSELQELNYSGKLCTEDLQCLAAQDSGRDVGALCNEETGLCHPEQDCWRWLMFWAGGMTFYGSILLASVSTAYLAVKYRMGMLWAPKITDLPRSSNIPVFGVIAHYVRYLYKFPQGLLKYLDFGFPLVALAHALGRVGCFLAGCCFGKTTDLPVGLSFPGGSPAYQLHRKEHLHDILAQYKELGEHLSLAVHPTQLYSAGLNFLIFLFLWFWVRKRKQFHGQVAATMLVMYGLSRFSIEFFRADYRGEVLGLSTSQWISLPLIMLALYGLWRGFAQSRGPAGATEGSSLIIDDGGDPPLGRPLEETMHQPEVVTWDGKEVSPVSDWKDAFETLMQKLGKRPADGDSSSNDR